MLRLLANFILGALYFTKARVITRIDAFLAASHTLVACGNLLTRVLLPAIEQVLNRQIRRIRAGQQGNEAYQYLIVKSGSMTLPVLGVRATVFETSNCFPKLKFAATTRTRASIGDPMSFPPTAAGHLFLCFPCCHRHGGVSRISLSYSMAQL